MPEPRRPVVLVIRDGWGANPNADHHDFNAIALAHTPVADRLDDTCPSTLIRTSGRDVGLPDGTMGNSEVGHQNIGAGRIVDQELMRITRSIGSGAFFENEALLGAIDRALQSGGRIHLLGLVSDGQVHSDIEHLFALIDLASRRSVPADRLLVHAITDGRDTSPSRGLEYVTALQEKLDETGIGRIASVMGRFYAMDRDNRWERIEQAYRCLTDPAHERRSASAVTAVRRYYDQPTDDKRRGDEFIEPTVLTHADQPLPRIADGDSVIVFNFRGDRPRQITRAFMLDDEQFAQVPRGGFERRHRPRDLHWCTMTRYEQGLPVSAIAFDKPPKMDSILGEHVSRLGLRQFRCAETEKYAHVTFFFNDYREQPFDGEQRVLVPSPTDVTTYDEKPEMSAAGVCAAVVARLQADDCEDLIVVNFANPDMVGHTGNLDAVIRAVEVTDACVGRIIDAAAKRDGRLIITADHGNAEQMWDPINNCPHTAHTVYDVPLYVVGSGAALRAGGRLADIAPTVLELMEVEQPEAMTGVSLVGG